MTGRITNRLGFGIGWREELALWIERRTDLGFVEVIAENHDPDGPLSRPLSELIGRGIPVIPHGISLSLGGADRPSADRLSHLARLATRLNAPFVSEHIAFVRAAGVEVGHLMPVPQTRDALEILIENVRIAQESLPVPLVLENIAALIKWPDAELDEADLLCELLDRTGTGLLLDVSNVYANAVNHGGNPDEHLNRLPLDRVAYVHVGGGTHRKSVYHDTHAHPVPAPVFGLLETLCSLIDPPGVLLERDDNFPDDDTLAAEFDRMAAAARRGCRQREASDVAVPPC